MEVLREFSNGDLRVLFLRENQSVLVEALIINGFSEEKYRKLMKQIKEKLGEEFMGVININDSKALVRALSVGVDLMSDVTINDVINMEVNKISNWLSSGVIKELIEKAISEAKKKKARRKTKRKSRSSRSKGKKRRKSRKSSKSS
ncbi:hypothetical protein [Vulcanisaeta thermophila]|uniref:hypothetical protein n=1 Tax=Vulcanisaeta thermophila TaxID=867917 RepID=UPI000852979D|nr:hypothetical protein [Vulcanisaeta thermophila]